MKTNLSPTQEDFIRGIVEYEKHEKRDAMYKVATFLVNHFWGNPAEMADALGVLLLTWNQAFYRYGFFDFDELERVIRDNNNLIQAFRNRDISTLSGDGEAGIRNLFGQFLEALKITTEGNKKGAQSPVAVAKALHLLSPGFFPLWDREIAKAYGCTLYTNQGTEMYLRFCWLMKEMAANVKGYTTRSDRTILKFIDQYNYSKFTQGWI